MSYDVMQLLAFGAAVVFVSLAGLTCSLGVSSVIIRIDQGKAPSTTQLLDILDIQLQLIFIALVAIVMVVTWLYEVTGVAITMLFLMLLLIFVLVYEFWSKPTKAGLGRGENPHREGMSRFLWVIVSLGVIGLPVLGYLTLREDNNKGMAIFVVWLVGVTFLVGRALYSYYQGRHKRPLTRTLATMTWLTCLVSLGVSLYYIPNVVYPPPLVQTVALVASLTFAVIATVFEASLQRRI